MRKFHNPRFKSTILTLLVLLTGCSLRQQVQKPALQDKISPKGPIEPTWESIEKHYKIPEWFIDGKFGIFMHWGVYSVPAHHSEWYPRHMYSTPEDVVYHRKKYGPQDQFGYKDFVDLFKAEKFNPDTWAQLFKDAGAKYIIPTAEHHDGFAMWNSDLTAWDAVDKGPKRDLIGDLAQAVRKKGLKFGISNHSMEHWNFMYPNLDSVKTDLFDPRWFDFYGPPHHPDTLPNVEYQEDYWFARNKELVDKYQPDMVWFDNGVNNRDLDQIKLKFAAYYYNRAVEWGREVSISTKDHAYLAGSIEDFERQGRAPRNRTPFVWQVDDPIGHKFGYVEEIRYKNVELLIRRLVETVSKNGNYLLNISPKADGTIPELQKERLLEIGRWLRTNGEAIYGSRPWIQYGEGPSFSREKDLKPADNPPDETFSSTEFRFTAKGSTVYALAMDWPGESAVIKSLSTDNPDISGEVTSVRLLGYEPTLNFVHDKNGLKITLPREQIGSHVFAFRIDGLSWDKAARTTYQFDFGNGETAPGYIQILPEMTYNERIGYGFINDSTLSRVTSTDRDGPDLLRSDFCTSQSAFYFAVDLPEGNYKISLTMGDQEGATATTVKAELRRLMIENEKTDSGNFSTRTFLVNLRTPIIPYGGEVKLKDREKSFEFWAWDDKLTLEFNGPRPTICSMEISPIDKISVIYLLGNSTVCDQPLEPYNSWGQMLTRFFKSEVVIANHAESGESYQSSFARRRLDKIMSLIKPGDHLILQFGHNDMKLRGETIGPFTSFKSEIKQCIDETRKRGGVPVLVTPMQRRNFDENGKVVNSHGNYPEAVRQAAAEKKVPLIDLHKMSTLLYEALGTDGSEVLFSVVSDRTHHNNYGSYQLAKCIVEGIKANNLQIAKYLVDDLSLYDPRHPDSLEGWNFPASPAVTSILPEGN